MNNYSAHEPPRPLDGFRVLDFTANVAGPLAGQVLVDLGAEVIKVEPPGGEAGRRIVSAVADGEHVASYYLPHNRGKKSVVIDTRTREGVELALRLAETADVLLQAYRPGVMDRMGLGADVVQARNPRCIYASVSAFGGNGPLGMRPGIDAPVQAESGLCMGLQAQGEPPRVVASTVVDAATGHMLAQAVLAALLNRERHGVADQVSVAMYDAAVSLQAPHLTRQLYLDPESGLAKISGRDAASIAPSGPVRARDGYFLVYAYVPKHWQRLTEVIGRPDLAADPRFADQVHRARHRAELYQELDAAFAEHSVDESVELLQSAGLMAAKANTHTEVVRSAQFAENELAIQVGEGDRAEKMIRTPARFAAFAPAGTAPTPLLGEHDDELLAELTAAQSAAGTRDRAGAEVLGA
jgi:crotonobetainyl-CoA:carnitine CoA-transferase CaiB-like acyl-CoA transferase